MTNPEFFVFDRLPNSQTCVRQVCLFVIDNLVNIFGCDVGHAVVLTTYLEDQHPAFVHGKTLAAS